MPLDFDERCLLLPGVHDATLDEVERHLSLSGRRKNLFENLKTYFEMVRLTGWHCHLLVDGSFVMPKLAEPNDIDIILVLPTDWDMSRKLDRSCEYNVAGRTYTRGLKLEVFPVLLGSESYSNLFELFSQIRVEWCKKFGLPLESRKGLVRLTP